MHEEAERSKSCCGHARSASVLGGGSELAVQRVGGWRGLGFGGATCPIGYDGAADAKPAASWANAVRSGQLVGRWTRMRAVCSMTRAPILINRWRSVVTSARASGLIAGRRDLKPCMSQ